MIEIATCLNDLAKDAVWSTKGNYTRFAKISSVWEQNVKGAKTVCVGFYLWDSQGTEDEREAWKVGKVMAKADFLDTFEYARFYVLNEAREAEKVDYYISRTLSELSNCMDVEQRAEGRELAKRLVKLAKLSAGYDVLKHEWDEGCAGVGCCADTADMAGGMLVDDNALSKDEIDEILKDDEGDESMELR